MSVISSFVQDKVLFFQSARRTKVLRAAWDLDDAKKARFHNPALQCALTGSELNVQQPMHLCRTPVSDMRAKTLAVFCWRESEITLTCNHGTQASNRFATELVATGAYQESARGIFDSRKSFAG